MKIRQGFVSNSSSSSFCVKRSKYPTAADLAQDMVLCRGWENDEELFQKIEDCKDKENIAFNTCNFETYIATYDDVYTVQTCNNHNWWESIDGMCYDYPEELEEKGRDWGEAHDYCHHNLGKEKDFYWPEYDLMGSKPNISFPKIMDWKKENGCKHYCDLIETENGLICKLCESEKQ
jgi:hypothetical protein